MCGTRTSIRSRTTPARRWNGPAPRLGVASTDERLARAYNFQHQGNWEEVLLDFESIEWTPKMDVLFGTIAAILYYRRGDPQKAIDIFNDFAQEKTRTGTYAFRILVQLDVASKDQLQEEIRAMFEHRPRDQVTVQRYSDWVVCRLLGETDLATAAAEGFIKGAEALNKEQWLNHGAFMKNEKVPADLIDDCRGRRFDLAHAHFLIGIDRLSKGDRGRARESFQAVLDTNQFLYVDWWSEYLDPLDDPKWLPWLPEPQARDREGAHSRGNSPG